MRIERLRPCGQRGRCPSKADELHEAALLAASAASRLAVASASSGGLVFDGVINTNGGGFASCRTLGDEAPLGLAAGTSSVILVDATGDGQLHKLMLHTADSWQMSTPSWAHDFLTSEKRATYKLPLADFIPSKQGRPVSGAQLDGSGVTGPRPPSSW